MVEVMVCIDDKTNWLAGAEFFRLCQHKHTAAVVQRAFNHGLAKSSASNAACKRNAFKRCAADGGLARCKAALALSPGLLAHEAIVRATAAQKVNRPSVA